MKKILGICFIVVGFIISLIGALILFKIKSTTPSNISIIGGADGPTLIFISAKIGYPIYVIIAGVLAFIIGLILVFIKRKKCNGSNN